MSDGPRLDRDGYVGLDVHRVARVMSAAHGGQIVASESVAQAIGGGLPLDVELVSLGNVQLRGLPGDDVLHQVVTPRLQRDFPPPRGVVRGQATG